MQGAVLESEISTSIDVHITTVDSCEGGGVEDDIRIGSQGKTFIDTDAAAAQVQYPAIGGDGRVPAEVAVDLVDIQKKVGQDDTPSSRHVERPAVTCDDIVVKKVIRVSIRSSAGINISACGDSVLVARGYRIAVLIKAEVRGTEIDVAGGCQDETGVPYGVPRRGDGHLGITEKKVGGGRHRASGDDGKRVGSRTGVDSEITCS